MHTRRRTVTRQSTHVLRSGSKYTTRRTISIRDEQSESESESESETQTQTRATTPAIEDATVEVEEDEEEEEEETKAVQSNSDDDEDEDDKGSDDDDDDEEEETKADVDENNLSDSSASGVTESEAESVPPPVPETPGNYVPHHHWDTRLSSKFKRYQEYTGKRARRHWSQLRNTVKKSPLGQFVSAVASVLSPSVVNAPSSPGTPTTVEDISIVNSTVTTTTSSTEDLAQRLTFTESPPRGRLPAGSPPRMTLTIKGRHKPENRLCGFLMMVAALAFVLGLGWALMQVGPPLFWKHSAARAELTANGCDCATVEHLLVSQETATHHHVHSSISAHQVEVQKFLHSTQQHLGDLQVAVDGLRSSHEGSTTEINVSLTEVRSSLLERVTVLDAQAGKVLAQLEELRTSVEEHKPRTEALEAAVKQVKVQLGELQQAVLDIPKSHPDFDWVKNYVDQQVADRIASAQLAGAEGVSSDLSAQLTALSGQTRKAAEAAEAAHETASKAFATAGEARETAEGAKSSAEQAMERVLEALRVAQAAQDAVASGLSTLSPKVEEAANTASDSLQAADTAAASAREAHKKADAAAEGVERLEGDLARLGQAQGDLEASFKATAGKQQAAIEASRAAGSEAGALELVQRVQELAGEAAQDAAEALAKAKAAEASASQAEATANHAEAEATAVREAMQGAREAAQESLDKSEAARDEAATAITNLDVRISEVSTQVQNVAISVTETVNNNVGGGASFSGADADAIVEKAIDRIAAGVGMPDYAIHSAGAVVVFEPHMLSKTFEPKPTFVDQVMSMVGLVPHRGQSPNDVIHPDLHVGRCWPMAGSQGYITVRLSDPRGVRPTHFSVDHAHRAVAHTEGSTPQRMEAWGYKTVTDSSPVKLGSFRYDTKGPAVQTFARNENVQDKSFFPFVQLRVLSNWGNDHYTCVYRFRVHGEPGSPEVRH